MSTGEGPGNGPAESTGAPVPPYEGRKTGEDGPEQPTTRDGARTGGATGPVADGEMKAADPADTERGAAASPADEQPAADTPDGGSSEADTGPGHTPGTSRAEDHS